MSGRISYVVLACEVAVDFELENRGKSTSRARNSKLWKSPNALLHGYTFVVMSTDVS